MSLERSIPPSLAKEYLEKYSIRLSAKERGVMVIKSKDKTRASQRKGALSNWKVCSRQRITLKASFNVIHELFAENGQNSHQVSKEEEDDR